ncbi:MAG: flagellar biosynthetic protein FliR [Planctomycetota bacterium]
MEITLGSVLIYLLIVFRLLGCVMILPFFGVNQANFQKAAICVMLAFLVFPAAGMGVKAPALNAVYVVLVAQEILTGLVIGYIVQLSFMIISLAGEMASQEMGFRMSRQVDPITGNQAPAITLLYNLFAILLFFGLNGHHWVLEILSRSFRIVPLGTLNLNAGFGEWLAGLYARYFHMGIRLAAPIFLLMLMISIGVGLLAKLVQGINVFDIGFPIRIGVGLLFIMFFIPYIGKTLHRAFDAMNSGLMDLLMHI